MPVHRRKRVIAIGSLAVLSCAIVSVVGLGASTGGISLLGDLVHQYTVAPGEGYSDYLNLFNTGEAPASVRLYQTDYRFDADGNSFYDKPGLLPRSNAKWIQLGKSMVAVPPKKSLKVPYRIQVPKGRPLVGSYWSVIMVEPVADRGMQNGGSQPKKQVSFGVGMEMRYAVQIVTDIGPGGLYKLSFARPMLVREDEAHLFQLDLINDGERWLSPLVWLDLYDGKGALKGRFKGDKMRIYPGCSVRQRIPLCALESGTYQALVFADNGDEHVFGARYTLKVTAR